MTDIKLNELSKLLLITNLITNLLYSASYPYLYSMTIKVITDNYLSVKNIIMCISMILYSCIWNKYGDTLFKHYTLFSITEVILDIVLCIITISTHNLKVYFVVDYLIVGLITRSISCGGIKIRAKLNPTDTLRERFDNCSNITTAIGTIIGSILSIILFMDLNTILILALLGNVIDNILFIYIFKKIYKDV